MTLTQFLSQPNIASLSDQDAATAANAPILTPIGTPITYTTLQGSAVWGFAKAATFQAAVTAAIAVGGTLGAEANALDTTLSGPGLLATDPQIPTLAASFIALPNSGITQADVTNALFVTTFPVGTGTTQVADVTTARAYLAQQVVYQQWNDFYASGNALIDTAVNTGATLPTLAQLKAR